MKLVHSKTDIESLERFCEIVGDFVRLGAVWEGFIGIGFVRLVEVEMELGQDKTPS